MAAGGKGAPLVPFLDYMLFRHPHVGRIVQNIGGIANLTAIPAGAAANNVIAFDTGPGNGLMDEWCERHLGQPYDADGAYAASGRCHQGLLRTLLDDPYFVQNINRATAAGLFAGAYHFARPDVIVGTVNSDGSTVTVANTGTDEADHFILCPACGG